jgi:transposase InsO family protein
MKVLCPTTTHVMAMGITLLFRTHLFQWCGISSKVISDQGPQFISNFLKELYKLLNIDGAPSTAYHPQTNGQTEHANQEVEQYLHIYTNYQQDNWSDWLDIIEFALNDQIHTGTVTITQYRQ